MAADSALKIPLPKLVRLPPSTKELANKLVRSRSPQSVRKARDTRYLKVYGISVEHYDRLFVSQGGVCAVCHKPEKSKVNGKPIILSIDHNHNTGCVRGLLCRNCNTAIGLLQEDVTVVLKMVTYLMESPKCL